MVPTVSELEARIDEALVIARASEEGVREVGEMALDAAKQAHRAAELAASASAAAVEAAASAGGPAGPVTDLVPPPAAGAAGAASSGWSPEPAPPAGGGVDEPRLEEEQPSREIVVDPLQRFNERADAVAARLRELERIPV
jgi:hypothetical protein